jgi:hypothetical protein
MHAFAKTEAFQKLKDDYAEAATKVRLRPVETAPDREAIGVSPVAGTRPQQELDRVPSASPPPAKEVGAAKETRESLREKFRR